MKPRDRKNLFALTLGLSVPFFGWVANQLEPGQMLCIPAATLWGFGTFVGVTARTLGWWWGKK